MDTVADFRHLIVENIPLIDVRAPCEFAEGAFPTSTNLPLMDDKERHLVGTRYAESGSDAAVELGHSLVSGAVKAARVAAWLRFIEEHPGCAVYCFRGGMRSQIARNWIIEAGGSPLRRLEGGYKAFRNYLLEELEAFPSRFDPILLAGRTGSGKTRILGRVSNAVDLESLARHRGSSFGKEVDPQPSQATFENALVFQLVQLHAKGSRMVVLEDESRNIGRRILPPPLFSLMRKSPLVVVETPLDERVDNILEEYVLDDQRRLSERGLGDPLGEWEKRILMALDGVRKRLGGARHEEVRRLFLLAMESQRGGLGVDNHKKWIAFLLENYYDPMYDHQINARKDAVVFHGSPREVLEFLASSKLKTEVGLTE